MSWLLPISRHGNFSAATRIAVLKRAEGRIHLISLIGQAARELKARGWSSLDTLDWAADSKGFFACSLQRTLTLLHIDLLGNARVLWAPKASLSLATRAVPSPDGRHLAMIGFTLSTNMWMMENF